jgi:hypothetical protein
MRFSHAVMGWVLVLSACSSVERAPIDWTAADASGAVPDAGEIVVDAGEGVPDAGAPVTMDAGSPKSCQSKYECHAGQICSSGVCVSPPPQCQVDTDCAAGTLCSVTHQCQTGCANAHDCPAAQVCNTQTFMCEACVSASDCSDGQVCQGGACTGCSSDADCQVPPYDQQRRVCSQGLCRPPPMGCTDQGCQSMLGPRGYCDSSTNACGRYQCASDTDCPMSTCDLTTHACAPPSSMCNTQQCDMQCASMMQQCDHAMCQCTGGMSGGGMSCMTAADCGDPSVMVCSRSQCAVQAVNAQGGPCTLLDCVAGYSGTGCVSAVDKHRCDPTTCTVSASVGGPAVCK